MNKDVYVGVFDTEESFARAVQQMTDSKVKIEDIYAPVPVHHAVKNVAGSSRLPVLAYFFGIFAMLSVVAFLYYAAVISWPLNIGGKPSNAFPSFIIITLVLTILATTLMSLFAFSVSARLFPGKKAIVYDERAMDDKFIIVLKTDKVPDAENILKQNGANEIIRKTEENLTGTGAALVVIAFIPGLFFTSCDRDKNNAGYDYFPDMFYSRAYETYAPNPNFPDGKTLQLPVEGTVSRDAEIYPYKKTDEDLAKAAKLKNPFSPDSEILARGKIVYQNVCLQCHGEKGDGKGHLYTSGKYPYPPANLLAQRAVNRTDGEIYHIITVGFGIMAPHAIIVRPADRWRMALYVRTLQKKSVENVVR